MSTQTRQTRCRSGKKPYRRLLLEPLEDRRVLATFTVTHLGDGAVAGSGDLPGSLRQAIYDANQTPGTDTVVWQPGLFGTIVLTNGELQLTDDVTITGLAASQTMINAAGNSRVFRISGIPFDHTVNVNIGMLTLTGGNTTENGGAILSTFSHVTIRNATIQGNRATSGGAVAAEYVGSLSIENSIIANNSATQHGGGILGDSVTCTITDSTLFHNTSAISGGGVRTSNALGFSSRLSISASEIINNTTGGQGAGIYSRRMGLSVFRSLISGNTASSSGGGIWASDYFNSSTSVVIHTTNITGNLATGSGGGAFLYAEFGEVPGEGGVQLVNTTISANASMSHGGGVFLRAPTIESGASIENSTLSGNLAVGDGGGAYILPGTPSRIRVAYSTVASNQAARDGDGIFVGTGYVPYNNSIRLENTIVANNGPSLGFDNIHGVAQANFCLIEPSLNATISGTGNISLDPMLGPLTDNGGWTFTHALLPGSPAIDKGNPTAVPGVSDVPEFDQRGMPFGRVEDGDGNLTARIDIGAFEVQDTSIDGDFNDDGIYDCLDINALVAEIATGSNNPAYDLTGDKLVNLADRDAWLAEAAAFNGLASPYKLGDADLDGWVDGNDFIVWNAHKFTKLPAWCSGDFTADGLVDGLDFMAWNVNRFTSSNAPLVRTGTTTIQRSREELSRSFPLAERIDDLPRAQTHTQPFISPTAAPAAVENMLLRRTRGRLAEAAGVSPMALGWGIVEPLSPTVSPDIFAMRGTMEDNGSTN